VTNHTQHDTPNNQPDNEPTNRPRTLTDVPKTFALFTNAWRSILLLILAAALLRILYLTLLSPYALIEDEAHYWEWSRHLDWSYYSKGPGVAIAIRASTALLGDTAFAVRLPAILASLLITLAIAALATETTNDKRAGFFAAACVLLAPIFQMSAILMTIDGPYVAAWALAAWAAWRALTKKSATAWLALGTALAVGFLFKYTIILLPPGILLFALLNKNNLNLHKKWRLWASAATAIGLLGTLPIIIWNAQHDWVTFKHLLGHVALPGGDVSPDDQGLLRWNPLWTLELIAAQVALIGGVLFLSLYTTVEAIRRRNENAIAWIGHLFLISLSLPILIFYLAVTLFTEAEGNWPMAGFVTLIALSGWGVVDAMDRVNHLTQQWQSLPQSNRPKWGIYKKRPQLHRQLAWRASLVVGILSGAALFRLDLAAPPIDTLATYASHLAARLGVGSGKDLNIVPLGRMTSARPIAAEVQSRLQQLADKTDQQPFVIAQHYGRASQLAFYLNNHPTVYASSSLMGGRLTQYDIWAETDLRRADHLKGRPAVLLGGQQHQWERAFERVESIGPLKGDHKQRPAFLGYNFRGFNQEN
jgi:4-amino-4-deoxy-L-arabinose transferase-like glycosyltransferase